MFQLCMQSLVFVVIVLGQEKVVGLFEFFGEGCANKQGAPQQAGRKPFAAGFPINLVGADFIL